MSCRSPGNLTFGSHELVQVGSSTVEAHLGDTVGLVSDHHNIVSPLNLSVSQYI